MTPTPKSPVGTAEEQFEQTYQLVCERGLLSNFADKETFRRWFNFGVRCGRTQALASEWMPIESAPKDGTHFIAICADFKETGFGYFNGIWTFSQTVVHWFFDGFYLSVHEQDQQRPFKATHWRPLNEPPTDERRAE